MTQTGNVTMLPRREDEPREILRFARGYLESIYFGGGWKVLADVLTTHGNRIPPLMRPFVLTMAQRNDRPNIHQLSIMVGLLVAALTHDHFADFEKREPAASGEILPLKRK